METLNIRVMQLNMTVAKTNAVLEAGKPETIEKQLATLKAITAEIDRMRLHVEAKKLAAEEEIADIQTWNAHLDAKVEEADNEVVKVRKWLGDRKREAELLAQEEKLQFEEKLYKTKLELQMELQATQTSQHPLHTNTSSDIQAKLPKLVITKFKRHLHGLATILGTVYRDHRQNKRRTDNEILIPTRTARLQSKTNNRGVTLHVRGIQSRKSILVEKYGKESEIVILTYGWELLLEQQQILQAENLYTDLTYPLLLLAIEV